MEPLCRGRLIARLARSDEDLARAQALRWRAFRAALAGPGAGAGRDVDAFDARCLHLLVEDAREGGELLATCRLLPLASGAAIGQSYAAQYYDLAKLRHYPAPMLEVGRFCTRAGPVESDALRLAWGALTRFVDERGVALMFGASSFAGTDPSAYGTAFAHLARHHLGPARWMPAVRAPEVVRYGASNAAAGPFASDAESVRQAAVTGAAQAGLMPSAAMPAQIPPLLRSYLAMGGWVSDHAVVDRDMQTLHVFTGVEIAAIPPARARLLRALAGQMAAPVPT